MSKEVEKSIEIADTNEKKSAKKKGENEIQRNGKDATIKPFSGNVPDDFEQYRNKNSARVSIPHIRPLSF